MRNWLRAGVWAALCATTSLAVADEPPAAESPSAPASAGDDEVLLKNGGVVRGTIVSMDPGQEVAVLVAGAEQPRVIPWGEVANVERGKYAAGAEPPPPETPGYGETPGGYAAPVEPAPPPEPPPAQLGQPGVVRLHIETDDPDVRLIEEVSTTHGYVSGYGFAMTELREACAPPCDQIIDGRRGQSFYFDGDGVVTTDAFTLSGFSGNMTAHVDPGSRGLQIGGVIMLPLGAMVMLAGPIMIVLANVERTEYNYGYGEEDTQEIIFPEGNLVGGIMLGAGAGLLTGAIVMLVAGGSSYELVQGAPAGQTATKEREPRWWLGEF